MNLPDRTLKLTTWQIHSRDMSSKAAVEHLWWPVVRGLRTLDDARSQLGVEKASNIRCEKQSEFKIVRVETITNEYDES